MNRTSVKYSDLNARAKENYNAAQLGASLAHYGYFAMKLSTACGSAQQAMKHSASYEALSSLWVFSD